MQEMGYSVCKQQFGEQQTSVIASLQAFAFDSFDNLRFLCTLVHFGKCTLSCDLDRALIPARAP